MSSTWICHFDQILLNSDVIPTCIFRVLKPLDLTVLFQGKFRKKYHLRIESSITKMSLNFENHFDFLIWKSALFFFCKLDLHAVQLSYLCCLSSFTLKMINLCTLWLDDSKSSFWLLLGEKKLNIAFSKYYHRRIWWTQFLLLQQRWQIWSLFYKWSQHIFVIGAPSNFEFTAHGPVANFIKTITL